MSLLAARNVAVAEIQPWRHGQPLRSLFRENGHTCHQEEPQCGPSRRGRSAGCRPNNIRVVGLSCRGSVTSGGRGLRPTQGTVQREAIRDCVLSWMRPARWACVSRCPFSISHKKIIVSRCARQAGKEKTYAAAGSLRSGLDRAHMSTDVGTESRV